MHRFRHPLRGQLQRLVMNTILMMAWPERAYLSAHATKTTHEKTFRYSDCELCRVFNSRASNSSEPCSRHHEGPHLHQHVTTSIHVMAWPERAYLTAHAEKPTHSNSLRYQTASGVVSSTCERPIPAGSAHAIIYEGIEATLFIPLCTFPLPFVIPMAWEVTVPNNVCNAHLSGGTTKVQRELNEGVDVRHARRPR